MGRKLSVRYLWVDTLCIVQDDEIDKAGQLSSRGTIYKQAQFTIAAAAAAKASDGFLTGKASNFISNVTMAHLQFFVDDSACGKVKIMEHGFRMSNRKRANLCSLGAGHCRRCFSRHACWVSMPTSYCSGAGNGGSSQSRQLIYHTTIPVRTC